MATQQFKDFAKINGLTPHGYVSDIFLDTDMRYEIGEVESGVYFYGPVCNTTHFRKQVKGLDELVSHLYWYCGVQLNGHSANNAPRVPYIQ